MKRTEQFNMLVSTLVLILLIELLLFGGLGFAVPISVLTYFLFLGWRYKQYGHLLNLFKTPLLLIILLTSLCFALFDNFTLKFFNTFLLLGLILLHLSVIFDLNTEEKYSVKWFTKIFPIGLIMPFEHINPSLTSIKEEMIQDEERHTKLSSLKKIFIGCLIGIPIMLVAGYLLMFSDAAFEGIIDWTLSHIELDLGVFVRHLLAYILLFFPFMGFLHGLTHNSTKKSTEESLHAFKSPRKIDFTISMTIATLLSSVYILYLLSQFTYFFSAFEGILPTEYTYAAYARRGFFEMLPLAGLNLGMIALLNLFTTGHAERKKTITIKGFTTFLLAFTLIIISTALAKMSMYMNIYGLTLKRVFVTWMLILGVVCFVLIAIKIYRKHFQLNKYLFISFCILYLGLNYSNVDYLIGKYNFNLYQTKHINTIASFEDLSSSATNIYMEMLDFQMSKDPLLDKPYSYYHYRYLMLDERDWREENLAHYLAQKKWENIFRDEE